MKKIVFIFTLMIVTTLLMAQTATVGDVSGKVEVQEPGRSWQSARPGMVVAADSSISTGFASEATIVMDNAEISVRPLTRMTLEEYSSSGDTTTTKLFLGSGRIRTEVKTSDRRINDFQVRSPVATAAVRGTSFEFDGVRLMVDEGNVDFYSPTGAKVSVPAGTSSQATEEGGPVPPAEQKKQEASVSPTTTTGEDASSPDQESDTFESERSSATSTGLPPASLEIIIQ